MRIIRNRIMILVKRWYRSRKFQVIAFTITILCILYYISLNNTLHREPDLDITRSVVALHTGDWFLTAPTKPVTLKAIAPIILSPDNTVSNRKSVIEYIESKLREALKEDKGTGCEIPRLDPFAKEVTQFDKEMPKVVCDGQDWVKCYLSECRITQEIQRSTRDIRCEYRDILYESDNKYTLGPPTAVLGNDIYVLTRSDHVKIRCTGKYNNNVLPSKWQGYAVGFRATVKPKQSPPGREDSLNVLILGFDSTSRNGFIRRMPHSYKVLTEELQATVLNGYNIVGDGTPAALFPILTGKTELELPDVRRKKDNNGTLDSMPFIFYKLKEDGYRTAYFEDMPWIGTFQYRFNGFRHQPADHYLRDFYLEESNNGKKWSKGFKFRYCVGDTPQYKLMLNITEQFLKLDGKRFMFTFIADITHDDFNMIATSDDDVAYFLREFRRHKMEKDTLLIVMGDHGPRYAKVRDTLQGKLEERLPLMAILLPETLKESRPDAQTSLQINADALTTPHDVHAMILDVIGMTQHWNSYKVQGADLTRGMTLLEPITRNRSCSEAGIEPHWCACLRWANVSRQDAMYDNTANALVNFINSLTETVRDKCVPRILTGIEWVMKQQANNRLLSFSAAKDVDGYVGSFSANTTADKSTYQLKVAVGPGRGVYEASVTYYIRKNKFHIDVRDISRTNAYGNEPECISKTHPHLNMFCFCKDATPNET